MYVLVSLCYIDEETGEDLHAVCDAHLQQKQRALDDATNSALNHPGANRNSNAANFHVLLTSFRTLHR